MPNHICDAADSWDAAAAQHSKSIEDYAAVEAMCGDVPVYSFNNLIYVYGESPDLYPGARMQDDNGKPPVKIKLKKTWDIKNNFVGVCHEMTPRTRWNDSQPHLPIHLIDGDPNTIWSSFECLVPDGRPEWIRIDLPMEGMVSSVAITCNKAYMGKTTGGVYKPQWNFGNSLPRELTVRLSRDAWHWETVFDCENIFAYETEGETGNSPDYRIKSGDSAASAYLQGNPEDPDSIRISLKEPISAKQIWISANNFTKTGYEGYMFSINGAEVNSPAGDNLALVSRGAGVTVSSTSDHHNTDRYSANSLWGPLQYELGNKWTKVGSDNGSGLWCFTEHEKGVLKVDGEFDKAITEAVHNGMKVMLTLDFKGNWIYGNPPRKTDWRTARFREINESYMCGIPLVDDSPEMFQAYLNYVVYMVRHFKDRVEYFEIGNEWNCWDGKRTVEWYMNSIFEPTYDAIKSAEPEVKISLGSTGGFPAEALLECLGGRWGAGERPAAARRVSAISWHPGDFPDKEYFDKVRDFRRECEKLGFRGEYFCNEIYAGAAYPPGPLEDGNIFRLSDMREAKYLTRSIAGHSSLNIEAGNCHVHFTGFPHPQALCRTTWPSQVVAPSQPKPSYYCIRNIATAMDDFYETEFPVVFSDGADIICFTLENGDKSQRMIAAWAQAPLADAVTERQTDIALPDSRFEKAWGIDIFNGTEQELDIAPAESQTVIKGVRVKDYPVLLRFK